MAKFLLVLALLVVLIVVLPLGVMKLLFDYRAGKREHARNNTVSIDELQQLMDQHMEAATAPLRKRIEDLENELNRREQHRQKSVPDDTLIDDPSLEDGNLRA